MKVTTVHKTTSHVALVLTDVTPEQFMALKENIGKEVFVCSTELSTNPNAEIDRGVVDHTPELPGNETIGEFVVSNDNGSEGGGQ